MEAGFSKTQITPPLGTMLGGQPHAKRAEWVESELYAKAMCLRSAGGTVVLVSCDLLLLTNETVETIKRLISAAIPIRPESILIAATHTHSGPNTTEVLGVQQEGGYLHSLSEQIGKAAVRAHDELRPARLLATKCMVEGLAFNRRYVMRDGTVQTHPLKNDPNVLEAEGPADPDLGVLYAVDASGKFIGGLINFACHATVMERYSTCVSADYPGYATEMLSEMVCPGSPVLFVNGPCGNICQVNPFDPNHAEVGARWARYMGGKLAGAARDAIRSGGEEVTELSVATETLALPLREVREELVASARERLERSHPVEPGVMLSDYGSETFGALSHGKVSLEDLLRSEWGENFKASQLLLLDEESKNNPHAEVSVSVVFGNGFALVAIPCELFVEWGLEMKDKSPLKYTFISELTNGWVGYVPTEQAFSREGGYETMYSTVTRLREDSGRVLTDRIVALLRKQAKRGSRPENGL